MSPLMAWLDTLHPAWLLLLLAVAALELWLVEPPRTRISTRGVPEAPASPSPEPRESRGPRSTTPTTRAARNAAAGEP